MAVPFLLLVLIYVHFPKSTENEVHYVSKPSVNCLHIEEPENFTNKSNPLGEKCELDSSFVIEYCKADESHHDCSNCNGQILPNICFCDIGQQCNNDAPRKKSCTWCKEHCPCLHNGKCICDWTAATAADLRCKCPEGYDGLYCENIPYRTCKKDYVTTELENCTISRNETCFIDDDGSKLKCTILKKEDKSIPNCSSDVTIITKSPMDHMGLPNTSGGSCFLICYELIILVLVITIFQ
ncbi:uncharacterized protein LOC134706288 isoform X1 [Mytilus trossulus]|uniref:uncharacterized protein LOC134706288 isoform X1 n=1 Tax=Mytilus trossulus TaxID=6551 RepID=UPI003007AB4C